MGAFEVVAGYVTNPSTTITALTALTGQTYVVRAAPETAPIVLQQMWANDKTGGIFRVRSPRMHDNVQGIRTRVGAADQRLLLPPQVKESLYVTDTLTAEMTGGASETDQGCILLHYSQLPGSEGEFQTWAQVAPQIKQIMGVELEAEAGSAVSKWGPAVAINSSMDLFKRPANYALLGYHLNTACTAVTFKGTNVGELRCGGPGALEPDLTGDWFIRLSEESGEAAIPVFSSQNVASIYCEVCNVETSTKHNISLVCALLG